MTKKLTLSWLEGFLMEASEFKEYIIGMLFLKRLNELKIKGCSEI